MTLYLKTKIKGLVISICQKLILVIYNKDEIYKPNDLASHLNDEYHTEIFIKNILKNIKKQN